MINAQMLISCGGLLLLAAILFTNGSGGKGTPALKVDRDKIDYGYVKFGENRQFTFTVTNTGIPAWTENMTMACT